MQLIPNYSIHETKLNSVLCYRDFLYGIGSTSRYLRRRPGVTYKSYLKMKEKNIRIRRTN